MKKSAFTLVELLVAMTVLLLILGIIATILGESGRLWRLGTDRSRQLAAGRAALDMIAADLEQSVAGGNLVFALIGNGEDGPAGNGSAFSIHGFACNEIFFHLVGAALPPPGSRAVKQVWYGPQEMGGAGNGSGRYRLVRRRHALANDQPPPTENYFEDLADAETEPLLDGLAGVRFAATMHCGMDFADIEDAYTNALPAYVDIYLELLAPAVARRAAGMEDEARRADFIERNLLRLTRRVALNPAGWP